MKLNLQILQSDLQKYCKRAHIVSSFETRTLQFVSLYRYRNSIQEDTAYIFSSELVRERMERLPNGTFLFVGEPLIEPEETMDYLVFDEHLAIIDLMERIQRIFQRYEEWEGNLQRAAINGQELKKLGMLATAILDNPIQFYNQKTLNCIFNVYEAGNYELPDSFPEVNESGYMQPELLLNLKIENILSTVAKHPMLIIRDNLTLPAIMQDIVIDGSTMGRIIVFQVHKKLDERDMSLLMVFTDFLKQVLMYNPKLYNVHSQFIDVTLSRLIEGEKQNQYIHIFKTWLACDMNISETAKRLYMHRNTLLYKLDKIREILGNTLENYESRLLLMLALQILEYEGEEKV